MANSSNPEGPVRQYDCEETPRVRLERLITERYGYLNNISQLEACVRVLNQEIADAESVVEDEEGIVYTGQFTD